MTQVSGFSVWPKFTQVFFIIFLRIKLIFKFCPLTFGWLGMELYSFFILFSSHEIISILWSKCEFERFAQVNLGFFFFLNLIFFSISSLALDWFGIDARHVFLPLFTGLSWSYKPGQGFDGLTRVVLSLFFLNRFFYI
jgi:hypothetical protein